VWGESKHAAVIDSDVWAGLADPGSQIVGAPAYAVDVSPDGVWASIAAAGRTAEGLDHVEVVAHLPGVEWVVTQLAGMVLRNRPCAVVVDGASLAASLLPALREAGLDPVVTSAREMAQACGGFYTAAVTGQLRHLDYKDLNAAVAVARRRDLGTEGAWAWARKGQADITPLVAATLARYGHAVHGIADNRPPNIW